MSIDAVKWAYEQDVNVPSAKFLLITLAYHYNSKTGRCDPSIERLSVMLGMHRATIFRALEVLAAQDLVHWDKRKGTSNKYILSMEKSQAATTSTNEKSQSATEKSQSATKKSHCATLKVKNIKNNTPKGVTRARKLSHDWEITDRLRSWAKENVPHVDTRLETDKFIDYFTDKGEARKSWEGSWRNWMRRSAKDYEPRGSSKFKRFPTKAEAQRERNHRIIAEALGKPQPMESTISTGGRKLLGNSDQG